MLSHFLSYYQVRYYFKAGNSVAPVNNFGRSTIAIYPPNLFGERTSTGVTEPFIHYGQPNTPSSAPKGCSSTILIMYHKESSQINNAFEQQIQVNIDSSHLEDVFNQTELMFCVELWFAEETER